MGVETAPLLVSQEDIDWTYISKFGEYISPWITNKHYSLLKDLKTLDSKNNSYLKEK